MAKIMPCSDRDYNKLAVALTKFNLAHLPAEADKNISIGFVIRQSAWDLWGGVAGRILLGNCLNIDILWVDEKYRKQGYGSQLLITIEEYARGVGSHLSQVDTFDFQALDFYQKNGYEVFGVLEDCPSIGNKRYYLQKHLDRV